MQLSPFLRAILKIDAATCLGSAVLVLPLASALQAPLGVQPTLLAGAAASLVPIGLFILWLGTRRQAPASLVWLVILGNIGWSAASVATAATLEGMTPLGQAAIAGQGFGVLAIAFAEYAGLRGSRQLGVKPA